MGEYYVAFDEESGCWGVWHTDSNSEHCHALYTTEEEAVHYAAEWNGLA